MPNVNRCNECQVIYPDDFKGACSFCCRSVISVNFNPIPRLKCSVCGIYTTRIKKYCQDDELSCPSCKENMDEYDLTTLNTVDMNTNSTTSIIVLVKQVMKCFKSVVE